MSDGDVAGSGGLMYIGWRCCSHIGVCCILSIFQKLLQERTEVTHDYI